MDSTNSAIKVNVVAGSVASVKASLAGGEVGAHLTAIGDFVQGVQGNPL